MSKTSADSCVPRAASECDVCYEPAEARSALQRCGRCCNRFYCSSRCQKNDWSKHKLNCSELPTGPLLPFELSKEEASLLDDEFVRVSGVVSALRDSWKGIPDRPKNHPDLSNAALAAFSVIELAPRFQYDPPASLAPAKDRTSKPSRHLRISLRRLYLIELVFHLSSEERGELQRVISSAQLPSSFPRLFGPKVVARPDKLSPGEYEMLPQILEIYLMGFEHSDCPEETRPGPSLEAIARAHQELSGILWRLS